MQTIDSILSGQAAICVGEIIHQIQIRQMMLRRQALNAFIQLLDIFIGTQIT